MHIIAIPVLILTVFGWLQDSLTGYESTAKDARVGYRKGGSEADVVISFYVVRELQSNQQRSASEHLLANRVLYNLLKCNVISIVYLSCVCIRQGVK